VPPLYRFAADDPARRILWEEMPLKRLADLPTIDQLRARDRGDDLVFAELAAVLARHHAQNRFGITLLYQRLPLRPGEIMLEQIDPSRRRITITPTTDYRDAVEVAWRLHPAREPMAQCVRFAARPSFAPLDLPSDNGSWA
jgi:hypothetical protein